MKTKITIIVLLASLAVRYLHLQNKKKAKAIKSKMQDRIKIAHKIKAIKESSYGKHEVSGLLITMLEDFQLRQNIQPTLSETELVEIEKKLNLRLPLSYKLFLKFFGDGGTWVYCNSMDSIRSPFWLLGFKNEIDTYLQLDNTKIKTDALLCLMSEDSNGGAWCWITSEHTKDGEWPLVYYLDKKLHYKVENFTEWLKILVNSKGEVIRELDLNDTLGLG